MSPSARSKREGSVLTIKGSHKKTFYETSTVRVGRYPKSKITVMFKKF